MVIPIIGGLIGAGATGAGAALAINAIVRLLITLGVISASALVTYHLERAGAPDAAATTIKKGADLASKLAEQGEESANLMAPLLLIGGLFLVLSLARGK